MTTFPQFPADPSALALKCCKTCNQAKLLENFYQVRNCRRAECIPCYLERCRERRRQVRELELQADALGQPRPQRPAGMKTGGQRALERKAAGLPPYEEKERRRRRNNDRRRRLATYLECKAFLDALKLSRGCADCGYNQHPAALEFDHLPGMTKVATVSQMASRSAPRQKLMEEISKCELVCANCHVIRTVQRRADPKVRAEIGAKVRATYREKLKQNG